MRWYLFFFIIPILFSSCATLLNEPYMNVEIQTTEPSEIIYKKDTIKTINNEANLWVERKKEKLSFVTTTDSISKTIEVKSGLSSAFWLGNLFSGVGIVGYAVDLTNPKRYTYPNRVYINSAKTDNKYYRFNPIINKKGELHLHLSLPHINSFCIKPPSESYKGSFGFWGISAGLDYYHSQNQFINVSASGVMDFFFPIPAAIDLSGEHKLSNSLYFSLSNNHKINRFSIGYGLSYVKNTWKFMYYDRFDPPPPTRDPVTRKYDAVGFVFPAYFQIREHFNIGVIYRPTFYRPNLPNKFSYEHLISVDFAWKIRIKE